MKRQVKGLENMFSTSVTKGYMKGLHKSNSKTIHSIGKK